MREFKLGVPCLKPFEEHDFIVMEERLLEDVSNIERWWSAQGLACRKEGICR